MLKRLSLLAVAAAFAVSSSAAMLQSARPALADQDDHVRHHQRADRDDHQNRTWNNGGNYRNRNWTYTGNYNGNGSWYNGSRNTNWNNGYWNNGHWNNGHHYGQRKRRDHDGDRDDRRHRR